MLRCFQIKVDKNCCLEVIHTKPLHRYNSAKVNGTDMQNIMEGNLLNIYIYLVSLLLSTNAKVTILCTTVKF